MNTQQIDAQVLAVLQAESDGLAEGTEGPRKDLFDMSKNNCRAAAANRC